MTTKLEPGLQPGHALTITRVFAAPKELVFSIWTTAEHVIKWWGPKAFTTAPDAIWQFQVGGAYRIAISSEKHGVNYMGGRFLEITPNERIVFTFAWEGAANSIGQETLITVSFSEADGRTTQSFHQAPFLNADTRDSHIGGWTQVIDRQEAYLDTIGDTP